MRVVRYALAALLVAAALFWVTLPSVGRLRSEMPETTAFIERRRAKLREEGRPDSIARIVVPLSRISPALRRAAVVTEDENFYSHHGVDWEATKLAVETDLEKRQMKVGGSTITQQLAKNLYLSPSRNPLRKLREVAIAWKLERALTKNRILEIYLNSIEWGERIYGAEAASRSYFGHSAAELSPHEAAMLAAMIASPRLFDPRKHNARLERRTARILHLMARIQIPGVLSK